MSSVEIDSPYSSSASSCSNSPAHLNTPGLSGTLGAFQITDLTEPTGTRRKLFF